MELSLTLCLSINGYRTRIATVVELHRELAPFAGEAFREVWIGAIDGQALCALFNGRIGWLLYTRESGDAGFSSRNLDYEGEADAMLEYRLGNGQHDLYPAQWALPESRAIKALEYFVECQRRAPFVEWHEDSA
jgi:hypothetical protein